MTGVAAYRRSVSIDADRLAEGSGADATATDRSGVTAGGPQQLPKARPPGTNVRRLRLRQRKRAAGSIVLEVGGRCTVAELADVSETGAGLYTQYPIDPGTSVTLHFADGRVVTGTVTWTNSTRAGVEFHKTVSSPAADHSTRNGQGSLLTGLWQRLMGNTSDRGPSRRLTERACRENGMAWLASEDADHELRQP